MDDSKWLDEMYKLDEKLGVALEAESNELKKTMDGRHERMYNLRGTSVSEAQLWEEQRLGGIEAEKILKETYPEVFALGQVRGAISNEINILLTKALGFDPRELNASRIIKMVHKIIKYEISKQ
jgi:hypothetical protein